METKVPASNGELWADDSGGDGMPLVLLHPGVGDSTIWDPVLPALTARRRVIRYDSRGFGRSPAPTAAYSLVEDLAAVLDHFGLSRAVLVGSSMGGATSISLALDARDRVAGLALFMPGVTGYDGTPPGFYEQVGKLASAGDMEGIVQLALGIWGRAGGGSPKADPVAAAQLRGVLPAWFSIAGHQGTDAPAFDRLGDIAAPALLALGELDQPEVVRCNEEIADRIPRCRLVRLAASDHFPTLREPEIVVQLIERL
ncbi:alpha/beta fold hydrolase [Streptomyces sp. PKU-EA00015]|uniref:alpha/beta fold hydrolase n=1 Tax=Streptomyces sp. PKU-EA00015 TaxID=2748326 RepID=UPI0015A32271|nr:alpha/beta fold hydrolase [Streptomyces sp. PKU-EA00015]NWF27416.1 alpha/beta fold hydrolase [Streptomyces sp. PKU-EA00015]